MPKKSQAWKKDDCSWADRPASLIVSGIASDASCHFLRTGKSAKPSPSYSSLPKKGTRMCSQRWLSTHGIWSMAGDMGVLSQVGAICLPSSRKKDKCRISRMVVMRARFCGRPAPALPAIRSLRRRTTVAVGVGAAVAEADHIDLFQIRCGSYITSNQQLAS